MTDQNSKKLSAIVPLPPREVSAAPYIVQPGDTVESITGRFTHPARWPGLVGANVHRKELADAEGQRHAVFADLKVGEALLIPAAWVGVGTPLERRIARMNERLGRTQAPKTLTQMQIANPWDQRHPQWPGSQVAYWSQRIEAIINHEPNWHVGYHKSCAQELASGQGRGRLVAWLRSFGTPQQLVDAFDTGPLGVALYVPDDLWFYGADRNVAVRAANSFAGQSQCGRTSGSVGAPGQVGGCQTYGMEQFGGVAGFKQMTQGRPQSQAQLQAAPKQLPQFQSVWDQKHPNWNGSNLAYWTQRIEAYILATPIAPPGLPAGWQSLLRGFLRQWPTPEAFLEATLYPWPGGGAGHKPPTVTGEDFPTTFPNQQAATEWYRQAYSVPGYWYASGDDPKFAAVVGYYVFPAYARKVASAINTSAPPAIAHQGSVGVPFSPIEPQLVGVVSPPNPIVAFFVANWAKIEKAIKVYAGNPNWQVPVSPTGQPYTPADIARVVAGFIPYLAKMPAGSIPATITPVIPLPADPAVWGDMMGALAKSAAELLGATGVKTGEVLQVVPWDEVPWHSFPWPAVKSFPNCWSFFQSSMQTETVGQQMSSKLFGSGAQLQKSGAQLLSPAPNYTPSFLQSDFWQQAPWTEVPWGEINWSTVDPTIWNNDKVVACMKGAGASQRLQQMFARQDCFIGKGADVFAKYLCPKADGTYEDLTTCNQVLPPLPGCPAGMHLDENGVCVPDGQGGQFPKCAAGYQAYPAPQLPQGIACCPDGSIFDLTTGQCLKAGQPGTDPASPVAPAAETQGLSTFAKAAIAVAAAGTLGLVYAIGKKS